LEGPKNPSFLQEFMVRPIFETFTPSAASLTGFASNVTGATWTLTANSVPDGLAHQVSLRNDSVTDHSGKTATFVGTDQDGAAQTETIAMPGASATVETTLYFATLTSVTPSATIGADTMDIGYVDEFSSRTIPANWRGGEAVVGTAPSGTINTSIQYTLDNIQGQPNTPAASRPYNWQEDTGTDVVNTSVIASTPFYTIPMAWRLIANSYSSGASVQLTISQMNEPSR
jgi:hypothetical protein